MKTLLISIASLPLGVVSALVTSTAKETIMQLADRFPEEDPKLLWEAHKAWYKKALRGQIEEDIDGFSDEEMDVLFLRELDIIKSQQK